MSKNIMVSDEAYERLNAMKEGEQDSFSKVIIRNVHKPAETGAELFEVFSRFNPKLDQELFAAVRAGRGRRSTRK